MTEMSNFDSKIARKLEASGAVAELPAEGWRFVEDTDRILKLFSDLQRSAEFRTVFGDVTVAIRDVEPSKGWVNGSQESNADLPPFRDVELKGEKDELAVVFTLDLGPAGMFSSLRVHSVADMDETYTGYCGKDDLDRLVGIAENIIVERTASKIELACGIAPSQAYPRP